jgi:hypothetical protein
MSRFSWHSNSLSWFWSGTANPRMCVKSKDSGDGNLQLSPARLSFSIIRDNSKTAGIVQGIYKQRPQRHCSSNRGENSAHWLTDPSGGRSTTSEISPLGDERDIPDRWLYTSSITLRVSILLRVFKIFISARGSVLNSIIHCLCNSNTFTNFRYHSKTNLHCLDVKRTLAILFCALNHG